VPAISWTWLIPGYRFRRANCRLHTLSYDAHGADIGTAVQQYEALGELFRETRRELFELTQWRRTLEIIKNLLNVLAVKLCINVADTMENLMEGTQTVGELEAILLALSPLDAVADY
jgi:hypothetical protein